MDTLTVNVGCVSIGGNNPIVVQTMCNTHTNDVAATVAQCRRLAAAGAGIIRITVPGLKDVSCVREIVSTLRAENIATPIVADVHFSSETAIAVAPFVDKVRINPGNFHHEHEKACTQFARLVEVCKSCGTAIRIGLNHGSLGTRITGLYGNTPEAMCKAAMEWAELCIANEFLDVVISLKASNTRVMVEAYRLLAAAMQTRGPVFPLHVGVTEAGNGDSGRIKSCIGISTLLSEGIGNTVRVSLTEDPEEEIPVARYLSLRYGGLCPSSLVSMKTGNRTVTATYAAPSREKLVLDVACDFGKALLDKIIDELILVGTYEDDKGREISIETGGLGVYIVDEMMQAARRRFYRPDYIACPGCGRTMYNLQDTFEEVKARTSHLKDVVIAVMGCIVNGPGEMADADWGYVGEGGHKVTIYHKNEAVLRHIPDTEAVDRLVELIEAGI